MKIFERLITFIIKLNWLRDIICDYLLHILFSIPIFKKPKINNIVFVPFDEFYFFKFDILLADFLSNTCGRTTLVTTKYSRFVRYYASIFGLHTMRVTSGHRKARADAEEIFSLFESECFNRSSKQVDKRRAIDFCRDGVPYGKMIVSDFLGRTRSSAYEEMFENTSTRFKILDRLAVGLLVSNFFLRRDNSLDLAVFNEKNFLPSSVLSYRLMQSGCQILEWKPTQKRGYICIKKYREDNWYTHPFSISLTPQNFFSMLNPDKSKLLGENLLEVKYKNNNWYNRDVLIGKSDYDPELLLDRLKEIRETAKKGIVGIFPHIFWDATFSYGENYFTDYRDLFEDIFSIIGRHPEVYFVVKFHPDYAYKAKQASQDLCSDFKHTLGRLARYSNVLVILPNIVVDLSKLLKLIDTVVTVRGTVGIEAALLGKNVAVFGTGRYSEYGFVKVYKKIQEFEDDISSFGGLIPSLPNVADRARLFWNLLYEETPIDLNENVRFSPYGKSAMHPLRINYRIKKRIDINGFSASRIMAVVQQA